jgi:hypothetical protein
VHPARGALVALLLGVGLLAALAAIEPEPRQLRLADVSADIFRERREPQDMIQDRYQKEDR